jgi:hypothetical protein
MGYEPNDWLINDKFIDGLRSYQSRFIRQKRDELREYDNKDKINEIDLERIMDLLIARTIDYNDNRPKANPKSSKSYYSIKS